MRVGADGVMTKSRKVGDSSKEKMVTVKKAVLLVINLSARKYHI